MVIFRKLKSDKLNRIKNSCERQYKVEVKKIHTLYVYGGKIKGVDFVTKQGVEHIASNTAICDKIVHVLNK
jgi:ribosomal protein L23